MLASVAALLSIPAPVAAAPSALTDGTVTPGSGTTATTFTFTVRYSSETGFEAARVWADVAGSQVELALLTGNPEKGTWQGGSTLPAGDWPVTFEADASNGSDPSLAGPTVSVVAADPPPPPATPTPTPAPTPVATATPGPMPPTPTATQGTPPTPPPTSGPDPESAPTVGSRRVPAAPAPGASAAAGTGSTSSVPEASAGPVSSAGAPAPAQSGSPSAAEAAAPRDGAIDTFAEAREGTLAATSAAAGNGLGAVPWVLLGTAMAMIGAGILGVQVRARRDGRPV